MAILITDDILTQITNDLTKCTESFTVVSAYCKKELLKYFDSYLPNNLDKALLVRFRPDDILSKATDFSLYEYCCLHGWEMYVRFDSHAKTYIFDNLKGIIGSANATKSGLRLGGIGNYEMAAVFQLESKDIIAIKSLIASSVKMNIDIYRMMKLYIEKNSCNGQSSSITRWPNKIENMVNYDFSILFSEDFPKMSPQELDKQSIENVRRDASGLKYAFVHSKCYLWLISILKEKDNHMIFFGELTERLHNVLLREPKPYRKDVKIMLRNLLEWVNFFDCSDIVIDIPNHSQRIRLNGVQYGQDIQ